MRTSNSSVTQSSLTLCSPIDAARQASLSITNSHILPKPMSIESVMPSHPLSSPSPPILNLSQHQGLFKWVSSSYQVAKVLEFQLQHQSFQWTPGLISFRLDWWDLLAVQGTLKSLLQHHSSKASIRWPSAFFMVRLSHPYMTTGKTIALTERTFVGKVMSLLLTLGFPGGSVVKASACSAGYLGLISELGRSPGERNGYPLQYSCWRIPWREELLSRLVITFLPRSKCLLILWLPSPSAGILEPPHIKSATVSLSICHEVMRPDAMIFVCWALSQLFHSRLSLSSRGSLVLLHLLPEGLCHLHIWGYWYVFQQSSF